MYLSDFVSFSFFTHVITGNLRNQRYYVSHGIGTGLMLVLVVR